MLVLKLTVSTPRHNSITIEAPIFSGNIYSRFWTPRRRFYHSILNEDQGEKMSCRFKIEFIVPKRVNRIFTSICWLKSAFSQINRTQANFCGTCKPFRSVTEQSLGCFHELNNIVFLKTTCPNLWKWISTFLHSSYSYRIEVTLTNLHVVIKREFLYLLLSCKKYLAEIKLQEQQLKEPKT